MSESAPEPKPSGKAAKKPSKPRSPVERIIVWGLIGLLVIVLGVEAHGKMSYDASLSSSQAQIAATENSNDDLTIEAAQKSIRGFAGRTESESSGSHGRQSITYRWPSLFKTYIIQLNSQKGIVYSYETPDAVEPAKPSPAVTTSTSAAPPPMMGSPLVGPPMPKSESEEPAIEPKAETQAEPKAESQAEPKLHSEPTQDPQSEAKPDAAP